jgi:hypothetical protein
MAFREVSVVGVKEVLRLWLMGHAVRAIARHAQVDCKTVRRYLDAAGCAGLSPGDEQGVLTDELIGDRGSGETGTTERWARARLGVAVGQPGVPRREAQRGSHCHQGPRALRAPRW